MKTEEILNLDCNKEENKNKINKMLWKIKVVKNLTKHGVGLYHTLNCEQLEQVLHGICIRYNFMIQNISPYYEDNKFKFYLVSLKHGSEWIGNVYAVSMWEVLAKSIIKIYSEIMKERKQQQ